LSTIQLPCPVRRTDRKGLVVVMPVKSQRHHKQRLSDFKERCRRQKHLANKKSNNCISEAFLSGTINPAQKRKLTVVWMIMNSIALISFGLSPFPKCIIITCPLVPFSARMQHAFKYSFMWHRINICVH